MGFLLKEHGKGRLICVEDEKHIDHFDEDSKVLTLSEDSFNQYKDLKTKTFREGYYCYKIDRTEKQITIEADYFIGLDWLVTGLRYVHVEPKLNTVTRIYFERHLESDDNVQEKIDNFDNSYENNFLQNTTYKEINYLKMLMDIMSDSEVAKECSDLVRISWKEPNIKINPQLDQLTPFLIVQFLQLLKLIVRKGLKKSYYKVEENLNSRVKGKILVGRQIKKNVFKNQITKTYCEYQVFGIDNEENQFLKKIFDIATCYIDNNATIFRANRNAIDEVVNYCRPAFQQIGNEMQEERIKNFKHNSFFKEYAEAIRIGRYILKRFAYNIVKTTDKIVDTPPFWIDMPRLFELYVYQKLLSANVGNTSKIKYQFATYGNALDVLIKNGKHSMVIDAKYKLHYKHGQIHDDMRQVAGYARLNKVLTELCKNNPGFDPEAVPPCLIIYPDLEKGVDLLNKNVDGLKIDTLLAEEREIKAYHKIYKLGIMLPIIDESF